MRGIFISYRADNGKAWALLLGQHLIERFGEANVFLDKDTLRAGDWREQLRHAQDRAGVTLVLIGNRWLDSVDNEGRRRLERVDDVHRGEISAALSRTDMVVIPIIVDGASLPRAEDLPADIRGLAYQQARELSDNSARRRADLQMLVADVEAATGLLAAREPVHTWLPVVAGVAMGIVLLVVAELGMGLTLNRAEKLLVVLLTVAVTVAVWSRNILRKA